MEKIVVFFDAPGFTSKHYDQVWDELHAAGITHPKGLISHVGFQNPNGNWNVCDVWESAEAFEEFSKLLVPAIQKQGAPVPPPAIVPAHYVLTGEKEALVV